MANHPIRVALVVFAAAVAEACGSTSEANDPSALGGKADGFGDICPDFDGPLPTGSVANKHAQELAGLVRSRNQVGVFWAHNGAVKAKHDVLLAFDRLGRDLGKFELPAVVGGDFQDIAMGPGPDPTVDLIYLADVSELEEGTLIVHRFEEPTAAPEVRADLEVESLRLKLDVAKAVDIQAMLVDPTDNSLFVLTRTEGNEPALLLRAKAPIRDGADLKPVEAGRQMPPIPSEVVAADITPDGRQIALKIRREGVRLYPRGPGQSVAQALAGPFCTGPGAAGRDRSVALDPAGWGYTLVSDGLSPAISAIRVHAQCPEFDDIEVTGKLRADRAIEVSGLAASRRQPGVLWAHNDGGSGPRTELMAFDQDGTHRGDFVLSGAKNRDWEDLALGAGPDSSRDYLYIGDIGDNGLDRTKVFILRVPEPSVGEATDAEQAIVEFEEFELHYDDGDSHNAESMAVDPLTDAIYVVTKHSMDDAKTEVYMAAAPLLADQTNLLRRVLSQDDAKGLDERFTAADISSGGELFVLKVDDGPNLLWPRQGGEAIFELLQWPACKLPSPGGHHESIAFGPGGDEYFMVPEGKKPEVFRVSASD